MENFQYTLKEKKNLIREVVVCACIFNFAIFFNLMMIMCYVECVYIIEIYSKGEIIKEKQQTPKIEKCPWNGCKLH